MRQTLVFAMLACVTVLASLSLVTAQSKSCSPSGGLNFICGVQNPEDLVVIPNSRWMLASGMAPGSGLHLVDTTAKTVKNIYGTEASAQHDRAKYPRCPGPLDSKDMVLHGLALRAARSGGYTLYAVNHGTRQSVEIWTLSTSGPTPKATWVGCLLMPDKMEANSVAAFSDGTVLATVLIMPGKTYEDAFAGKNTGSVYMWKPGSADFEMMPGTELPANNGIETSADDKEFFVVSSTTKRIVAFSRTNPARVVRAAQLAEFAPDNVRLTTDNRLITAGMIDNEPACGGPPKNAAGIRCSRGYIAATVDPRTMAVTELGRGPANPSYTGVATAMRVGDELWLGSFNADRLAYRAVGR